MSWRRAARQRRAMRRDFGAGCTLKLCARTCRRLWMRRRASCRYTDRFTHKNVNVVFRKKKNNGWLREQAHTTNTPLVAANYNRQNRTDNPLDFLFTARVYFVVHMHAAWRSPKVLSRASMRCVRFFSRTAHNRIWDAPAARSIRLRVCVCRVDRSESGL